MQTQVGQDNPYAANTRVRLLTNVDGAKEINGHWVDHPLPAGTIVSITNHTPVNMRASINTHPSSATDFSYKLRTNLVENVLQESLEGPYTGTYDDQKIRHTALDTVRCPPDGPFGTYGIGQNTYIRRGNQYTYRRGSDIVTLRGGDLIHIHVKGTTKTGGPISNAKNAFYLKVHKVIQSLVPQQIPWRSQHYIPSANFEVV